MRTSIHTARHLMEATGHRAYQDRQTVAQTSSWIAAVGVTMETYYYVRQSIFTGRRSRRSCSALCGPDFQFAATSAVTSALENVSNNSKQVLAAKGRIAAAPYEMKLKILTAL